MTRIFAAILAVAIVAALEMRIEDPDGNVLRSGSEPQDRARRER
ncbi:MAG: hypothetical protein ACM3SU_17725 [Acidobacteriota bacterium]